MKWFVLTLCLVCGIAVAKNVICGEIEGNGVRVAVSDETVRGGSYYKLGHSTIKLTINAAEDTIWIYDKNITVIMPDTLTVEWKEYTIRCGHDSVTNEPLHIDGIPNSAELLARHEIAFTTQEEYEKYLSSNKVWVSDGEYQLGLRSDGVVVWREK